MNELRRPARSRWTFSAATILTVLIGLASRRLEWVPTWVGDLLWATTVYYLISAVTPRATRWRRGAAALTFSYLIEISQLYHHPWVDRIRDNPVGHLLLGSTFVWTDLVAYTAGVALGIATSAPLRSSTTGSTVTTAASEATRSAPTTDDPLGITIDGHDRQRDL